MLDYATFYKAVKFPTTSLSWRASKVNSIKISSSQWINVMQWKSVINTA